MTALQDLHTLVDWLPECAQGEAHQILLAHLKKHDPVAYAFFTAPEEDEPLTAEEIAKIDEALAEIDRDEPMIPDAALARELGL